MAQFFVQPRSLQDLGWPHLLDALAARTATPRGREKALDLPFLQSRHEVELSLQRLDELRILQERREFLPLANVTDVRAALGRARKQAVLTAAEVLACAALMQGSQNVRRFIARHREALPLVSVAAAGLPEATVLAGQIDAAIEPSGLLKDSASVTLADLRARVRSLHGALKDRIEALIADPAVAVHLQDQYFSVRGDRYVLPVNASFQSKLPGIVHNASQTGHTVFIEPQAVVSLGNELAIAQSWALEEEQRILVSFSREIGNHADLWLGALELLGELDVMQASGQLASSMGAESPELGEATQPLRLRRMRHPRLLLQGNAVVGNHVSLATGQLALVISGPNAGGKTATLTGVGLCALLVRAGLPIPAERGSLMPLFAGVHCAIGDAQDLTAGLSTFSAHLQQLRHVSDTAGQGWLVLIDEIAADTDPQEGAALARAVLEDLVEKRAQVFVSTHLEEIKALGVVDKRFGNARVGFDGGEGRATYRLELGMAGASNALALAEQLGIPQRILARADEYLSGRGMLSAALAQLQDEEKRVALLRTQLEGELELLGRKQGELATLTQQAKEAQRTAMQAAYAEVRQAFAGARQEVKTLVAALQAQPSLRVAQDVQTVLHEQTEALERAAAVPAAKQRVDIAATALQTGSWVRVESLGREGEIVQLDAAFAQVAFGGMRGRFKANDLTVVARPQRGLRALPWRAHLGPDDVAAAVPQQTQSRCDVRGFRVDEAERTVERFLDENYGHGHSLVMVIHGQGTGVLRHAVREILRHSPYVASSRPGEAHEGGDGVTVVHLA